MRYEPALAKALLVRTPSVLRALLQGLPDAWLEAPEGLGAWSPREVACHLADLEHDGWLPRVRMLLDEGDARPLPPIERERFRQRYAGTTLEEVLEEFGSARAANLRALDRMGLDDTALAAAGTHGVLGEVRVSQLLSAWVVHDLTHLSQITRALAAQYRDEVGPWSEFLSVLRPVRSRDAVPGPDGSEPDSNGRDGNGGDGSGRDGLHAGGAR